MSKVYIIILNWNGWRDTIECLESLLLLKYSEYRVVVCDNGSSDDSLSQLRQWGKGRFGDPGNNWQELSRTAAEAGGYGGDPSFVLVRNEDNLGFGAGNNVGMRYALARGDADCCWLLNNDTVVDPMALSELVERLEVKPGAGMCGSTLRHHADPSRIQALGGAVYYKWLGVAWHIGRTIAGEKLPNTRTVEEKLDYIVGASLLVRSCYLRDVGLMAEDYFLYFEEIDWAYRGKGRYGLAYAAQSIVYHKVGASIGTATIPSRKSYQCDYYTMRNRLLFTRRYIPEALIGVYAVLLVELVVRILCRRWDLACMIFRLILHGPDISVGRLGREEAIL